MEFAKGSRVLAGGYVFRNSRKSWQNDGFSPSLYSFHSRSYCWYFLHFLFFPQINRKVEENINEKISFTSLQTVKQELEVDCNFLYLVSNPYSHVYGPRYVNQAVVPSINRFGGLKKRNQKEFRTHKQHGIFDVIFLPFRMWHSWMFVRLFLEVYSPTAASLSYSSQP